LSGRNATDFGRTESATTDTGIGFSGWKITKKPFSEEEQH